MIEHAEHFTINRITRAQCGPRSRGRPRAVRAVSCYSSVNFRKKLDCFIQNFQLSLHEGVEELLQNLLQQQDVCRVKKRYFRRQNTFPRSLSDQIKCLTKQKKIMAIQSLHKKIRE